MTDPTLDALRAMLSPATRSVETPTMPPVRRRVCAKCPFGTGLDRSEQVQADALRTRLTAEPHRLWGCHETIDGRPQICAGFAATRPDLFPVGTIDAGAERALAARRFRALAAVPGATMHGSAGVDPIVGGRRDADRPGGVHFGAELSSRQKPGPSTRWARHAIAALVEDVLAAEGSALPVAPIGASVDDDAARWDALMRCPRIRLMDHDGVEAPGSVSADSADGGFSFTAEFWPVGTPHPSGQDDPTDARLCLATLADAIVAAAYRGDGTTG